MLPKIDSPVFELTLPISKHKVSYRPFLIKEQKILLMAGESDEKDFLYKNVKQIISNCCLSEINVEDLSIVDIEYFFLHLRAKSVGEIVDTKYRCQHYIEETEEYCNNLMDVSYNILDTEIDTENYNELIQLTDNMGIKMKYPDYKTIETAYENSGSDEEDVFGVIKSCIDYIYDQDNVYSLKEATKEEIDEFFDSLSVKQIREIKNYFNNLPTIKKEIKVKCNKCGFNHEINVKGLMNFFD